MGTLELREDKHLAQGCTAGQWQSWACPPDSQSLPLSQVALLAFWDISTLRRVPRVRGGSVFLWLLFLVWKVVFQLPCGAYENGLSWFARPHSAFLFFARLEEGRSGPGGECTVCIIRKVFIGLFPLQLTPLIKNKMNKQLCSFSFPNIAENLCGVVLGCMSWWCLSTKCKLRKGLRTSLPKRFSQGEWLNLE